MSYKAVFTWLYELIFLQLLYFETSENHVKRRKKTMPEFLSIKLLINCGIQSSLSLSLSLCPNIAEKFIFSNSISTLRIQTTLLLFSLLWISCLFRQVLNQKYHQ